MAETSPEVKEANEKLGKLFERARNSKDFREARRKGQDMAQLRLLGESSDENEITAIFHDTYDPADYHTDKNRPTIEEGKTHMLLGNVDGAKFDPEKVRDPDFYQDLVRNANLFLKIEEYVEIDFVKGAKRTRMIEIIKAVQSLGNGMNEKSFQEHMKKNNVKINEVYGRHGLLQVLVGFARAIEPVPYDKRDQVLTKKNFEITNDNLNPLFYKVSIGIGKRGLNEADRNSTVLKIGAAVVPSPSADDPADAADIPAPGDDDDDEEDPPAATAQPPAAQPTAIVVETEKPPAPAAAAQPSAAAQPPAVTAQPPAAAQLIDVTIGETSYELEVVPKDIEVEFDPAKGVYTVKTEEKQGIFTIESDTPGFKYNYKNQAGIDSGNDIWKFYKFEGLTYEKDSKSHPKVILTRLGGLETRPLPLVNLQEKGDAVKITNLFGPDIETQTATFDVENKTGKKFKFTYENDNGNQKILIESEGKSGYLVFKKGDADPESEVISDTFDKNFFAHYKFETKEGKLIFTEADKTETETEGALKGGYILTIKAPKNETFELVTDEDKSKVISIGGKTGEFTVDGDKVTYNTHGEGKTNTEKDLWLYYTIKKVAGSKELIIEKREKQYPYLEYDGGSITLVTKNGDEEKREKYTIENQDDVNISYKYADGKQVILLEKDGHGAELAPAMGKEFMFGSPAREAEHDLHNTHDIYFEGNVLKIEKSDKPRVTRMIYDSSKDKVYENAQSWKFIAQFPDGEKKEFTLEMPNDSSVMYGRTGDKPELRIYNSGDFNYLIFKPGDEVPSFKGDFSSENGYESKIEGNTIRIYKPATASGTTAIIGGTTIKASSTIEIPKDDTTGRKITVESNEKKFEVEVLPTGPKITSPGAEFFTAHLKENDDGSKQIEIKPAKIGDIEISDDKTKITLVLDNGHKLEPYTIVVPEEDKESIVLEKVTLKDTRYAVKVLYEKEGSKEYEFLTFDEPTKSNPIPEVKGKTSWLRPPARYVVRAEGSRIELVSMEEMRKLQVLETLLNKGLTEIKDEFETNFGLDSKDMPKLKAIGATEEGIGIFIRNLKSALRAVGSKLSNKEFEDKYHIGIIDALSKGRIEIGAKTEKTGTFKTTLAFGERSVNDLEKDIRKIIQLTYVKTLEDFNEKNKDLKPINGNVEDLVWHSSKDINSPKEGDFKATYEEAGSTGDTKTLIKVELWHNEKWDDVSGILKGNKTSFPDKDKVPSDGREDSEGWFQRYWTPW